MSWLKGSVDVNWLVTFIAQVGCAAGLAFFGDGSADAELARLLMASAFGQTISAGAKATTK